MKVLFKRWCIDAKGRTPVAVEPTRVDCIEEFSPGFVSAAGGESFPAATKVIMQGKQEYIVQGSVEEIAAALNVTQ